MKQWLVKFATLQPAVYKAVIVMFFTMLGSLGIVIAPGVPDGIAGFLAALGTLVAAIWVRPDVTPNAKVLAYVPDPIDHPGVVMPGEATTTAGSAAILTAARQGGTGEKEDEPIQ